MHRWDGNGFVVEGRIKVWEHAEPWYIVRWMFNGESSWLRPEQIADAVRIDECEAA